MKVGLSPRFTAAFQSPAGSLQRAGPESLDCRDEPHLGGSGALVKPKLFLFSHSVSTVLCLLCPCCWGKKQLFFCEENISGESASLLFSYHTFNLKHFVCLFVFCNLSC